VVHPPLRAPNLAAALTLAEAVALAAEHLPELVTTDIAVSTNGRQFERFPVFCDRILPTGQPCVNAAGPSRRSWCQRYQRFSRRRWIGGLRAAGY
jgi:hypothetical protein